MRLKCFHLQLKCWKLFQNIFYTYINWYGHYIYLGSYCLSFGYCLFFNTPDCVLIKYWALISKNNQSMNSNSFMSIEYYGIHLSLKRDHRLSLSWIWILRGLFRNYCYNTDISLSHWQVCVELGINIEET